MFFFDLLGFYGPILLNLLTIYLLSSKYYFLSWYIIGAVISSIINFTIKVLIKDPRPKEDLQLFNMKKKNKKRLTIDQYGFPSGHSQSCGYSTSYALMTIDNKNYIYLYIFLTLLTMYQRVKYKNHTTTQVIGGVLIGLVIGFIIYKISINISFYKLKNKKDDNAKQNNIVL